MRINHKVLSIPPYVSTSWGNILSLQSEQTGDHYTLIVHLKNGSIVRIPNIESLILHAIFDAHAKHMETEAKLSTPNIKNSSSTATQTKPLNLDHMSTMLCHNESERNSPDLPPYILKKVEELSLKMGFSDSATLPVPEPHCNCPHCQIARSMQKASEVNHHLVTHEEEEEEEIVEPQDLAFTSWIIRPIQKNLYKVTHPDHPEEEYQVFLEPPIGCTCGQKHCEHVRAVLLSS